MAMTIRRTANRAATIELAFTHQRYLLKKSILNSSYLLSSWSSSSPRFAGGRSCSGKLKRVLILPILRSRGVAPNKYRWCVKANLIVAALFAVLLIVIAIKAEDVILDGYEWSLSCLSRLLSCRLRSFYLCFGLTP